jgi:hypothetical protein
MVADEFGKARGQPKGKADSNKHYYCPEHNACTRQGDRTHKRQRKQHHDEEKSPAFGLFD